MAKVMMAHGTTTKCMDQEPYNGQMVVNTLENICMTKKMDMGLLSGVMEENMRVTGPMVNNMESVSI